MGTLFHFPKVPVERIKMEQSPSGTRFQWNKIPVEQDFREEGIGFDVHGLAPHGARIGFDVTLRDPRT